MGFNPLGPEDHYSGDQDMDMDEDPDPAVPPSGIPTHPIEISDESSFHAANYNALHPEGPYGASYQTGYPAYGYQYPPPLQPQPQQQPQQPLVQPPQQQEIIQRLKQVERDVQRERRSRRGLLKGLANLISGKNRRDY
ncbi:uncharacterized protein LOC110924478 [Helianthus annuus]|uniref:uncharacterized protein LOC110924478 n=1 Tax=Helianthus annuus TaxID=4232 RepID=UPI000B8FBBA5|nr:uncharacterized protein LOC110924478 [Helianthus annuus]